MDQKFILLNYITWMYNRYQNRSFYMTKSRIGKYILEVYSLTSMRIYLTFNINVSGKPINVLEIIYLLTVCISFFIP